MAVETGQVFGRLTVVTYSHSDTRRKRKYYKCLCSCGGSITTLGTALTTGNTKSCGCLAKEVASARRISPNHSDVTAVLLGYKHHAKKRSLSWELSRAEFEVLILQPCHYCGVLSSNTKRTKNTLLPLKYNGVDRKENTIGYTVANCVPCCCVCNRAKREMSYDAFITWCRGMAEQWSSL